MLTVVTMITTVCDSKVTSLPVKFLSTTATPNHPGISSEVLPGTNTLIHLGMVPPTHGHAFGVW